MANFWQKILSPFSLEHARSDPRFRAKYVSELPDQPLPWVVYLGRDSNKIVWGGVMQCPCGCKESIHLNFVHGHDAVWTYRVKRDGTITLFPSIWKNHGCRSHFFVREGLLQWAHHFAPAESQRGRHGRRRPPGKRSR
jgi:hypothetical protein